MNARVGLANETRDAVGFAQDLLALTKPRVTALVAVTMAAGALIAPGAFVPGAFVIAVLATTLVVGSANALNMFLERDVDGKMQRTRHRPLPAGRMAPRVALGFGVGLGIVGLVLLGTLVNTASMLLAAVALGSYVLVYTPLKRSTSAALYVGAVPGAMPPLIGWAAVTGELNLQAAVVFAILFAWQLPHFGAIALSRVDEYRRAGLQVLPVVVGAERTKHVIIVTAVLTVATTALPVFVGLAGLWYLAAVLSFGVAFVALTLRGLSSSAGVHWARRVFFASMPYLVVVYGALVFAAF